VRGKESTREREEEWQKRGWRNREECETVRENERRFWLGFEEKRIHVACMHWNICQYFGEKGVHVTFMDWDIC
jgi:hypothetical protein